MPLARIVEVVYHEFMARLRAASDADVRIEPTDRTRWAAYVRDHGIKEASMMSIARARGAEDPKAVIIDDDSAWSGYYIYAPDVELCFKFQLDEA